MWTNFIRPIWIYCVLHRYWLVPLLLFPLLWTAGLMFLSSVHSEISIEQSMRQRQIFQLFIFAGGSAFAQLLLAFGLGISLKEKGSRSWYARLPFNAVWQGLLPFLLLAFFAAYSFLLYPLAWEKAQRATGYPFSAVMLLVPITVFMIVKSIRSTLIGIFSAITLILITFFTVELLYQPVYGLGSQYQFELNSYLPLAQWMFTACAVGLILVSTWRIKNLRLPVLFALVTVLAMFGYCAVNVLNQLRSDSSVALLFPSNGELAFRQKQCVDFSDELEKSSPRHIPGQPLANPVYFEKARKLLSSYPIQDREFESALLAKAPASELVKGKIIDLFLNTGDCAIGFLILGEMIIDGIVWPQISREEKDAALWDLIAQMGRYNNQAGSKLIQSAVTLRFLEQLLNNRLIDERFSGDLLKIKNTMRSAQDDFIQRTDRATYYRIPTQAMTDLLFYNLRKELTIQQDTQAALAQLLHQLQSQKQTSSGGSALIFV